MLRPQHPVYLRPSLDNKLIQLPYVYEIRPASTQQVPLFAVYSDFFRLSAEVYD